MASDTNDLNSKEKLRWGDGTKVYTRRKRKNGVSPATAAAVVETAATGVAAPVTDRFHKRRKRSENNDVAVPISETLEVERSIRNEDVDVSQTILQIIEARKTKLAEKPEKRRIQHQQDEAVPQIQDLLTVNFTSGNEHDGVELREGSVGGANGGVDDGGGGTQEVTREVVPESSSVGGGGTQEVNREVVLEGDSGGQPSDEVANGFVKPVTSRVDEDRVRISLSGASSKVEIRDIRRTLESELDHVRSFVKKLEAKELQLTSRNNASAIVSRSYYPQYTVSDNVMNSRSLMRVNSDVGSVRHIQIQSRPFRPPPRLAVVVDNNVVGEFMEREKRTPKANPYYKNSEFLLGKDRLPSESNKKLKTNRSGKKHKHGFAFDKHRKQLFRSCSDLLQRLMKHKHGWVFNEPVNVKALGLHDYYDIIKHPMDLGTIKTRLSENWYKSPKEFAEDIRLVFTNAMTYNPKGQDVHVMAEELSQFFEERWAVIEAKYIHGPTPTSRKFHHIPPFVHEPMPYHALTHAPQVRTLERSVSIKKPPVPKKPKAKDPDKRDMTYEEKQKLSRNLESLPPEKLEAIVQIIKKRSSAVNQNNEEIEVDIDSVDSETLWELDRFVTNYKKSLSKYKRKAELALQARARTAQSAPVTSSGPMVADALKESRTGEMNTSAPSTHVEGGRQADNASSSSSSSSSSSDSGSSSSDSDSDSSSTDGSDAGH
ncbi:hypothetical protein RND71_034746 [Anisodus tanguticus]|uniref:Transcription factor GTE4 n=1 Tax=Anisodus tanguticus TaxID=243964 RepID=A0AAE1R389_9SOLA|nr:hypothetical protein RND71_034746 [Anisodus tanguticus]